MVDREGKTIISLNEYNKLLEDLEKYKRIKEIKPLAEAIERELKLLTIWA